MTYYDSISEGYEELHREEQLKKIAVIKTLFNPKPNDKLLDVGCGTGITTQSWDCIRYGIDPAKKLIARAHDKDKIHYTVGQAENIPYPDKYFDWVISITAIQNFEDIEKGLSEIKRVGKGNYIISFLKRSSKASVIKGLILKLFNVMQEIEEEKDIILQIVNNPR